MAERERLDGPEGVSFECPICRRFSKYLLCSKIVDGRMCNGRVVNTFWSGRHCEVCSNTIATFTYSCGMRCKL